jgi:hypothetical protein
LLDPVHQFDDVASANADDRPILPFGDHRLEDPCDVLGRNQVLTVGEEPLRDHAKGPGARRLRLGRPLPLFFAGIHVLGQFREDLAGGGARLGQAHLRERTERRFPQLAVERISDRPGFRAGRLYQQIEPAALLVLDFPPLVGRAQRLDRLCCQLHGAVYRDVGGKFGERFSPIATWNTI